MTQERDIRQVAVKKIRADITTQPRERMDETHAQEMAFVLLLDANDPRRKSLEGDCPITFFDGRDYHLADGFHRVRGHVIAKRATIAVEVRKGTQRDAVLYSCGANGQHGLKRTNEDKRRAVRIMLTDPEWCNWSNRMIADQCAVSESMVRGWREELDATSEVIVFKRGGKTVTVPAHRAQQTKAPSDRGQRERESIARHDRETIAAEVSQIERSIRRKHEQLEEIDPAHPWVKSMREMDGFEVKAAAA